MRSISNRPLRETSEYCYGYLERSKIDNKLMSVSDLRLVALAAWNNVRPDQLPSHPSISKTDGPSMDAWQRVVSAVVRAVMADVSKA